MKVLVVKTSSLGDLIHTLPALTDAAQAIPDIRFDWVAEKSFAEIPTWHSKVDRVIPIAWRSWRKQPWQAWQEGSLQSFFRELRAESYDKIIDAQGLLKSAIVARMAKGLCCGLDFSSAREPLAALCYQQRVSVVFQQHAVKRMRQIFALALGYPLPEATPDYDIYQYFRAQKHSPATTEKQIFFIHGTTWPTKEWPETHWMELARYCVDAGFIVRLPWGNAEEKARAERIATVSEKIEVLPKLNLKELALLLLDATGAVAVDTGLGHLAAALNIPTVSLYGPTDPEQIGALGRDQVHLRAELRAGEKLPIIDDLSAKMVWERVSALLPREHRTPVRSEAIARTGVRDSRDGATG